MFGNLSGVPRRQPQVKEVEKVIEKEIEVIYPLDLDEVFSGFETMQWVNDNLFVLDSIMGADKSLSDLFPDEYHYDIAMEILSKLDLDDATKEDLKSEDTEVLMLALDDLNEAIFDRINEIHGELHLSVYNAMNPLAPVEITELDLDEVYKTIGECKKGLDRRKQECVKAHSTAFKKSGGKVFKRVRKEGVKAKKLTPKERAALKKMQQKAHRGVAEKKRKKANEAAKKDQ
jgi:hypothetical protein